MSQALPKISRNNNNTVDTLNIRMQNASVGSKTNKHNDIDFSVLHKKPTLIGDKVGFNLQTVPSIQKLNNSTSRISKSSIDRSENPSHIEFVH